jgi:hypothetical protein
MPLSPQEHAELVGLLQQETMDRKSASDLPILQAAKSGIGSEEMPREADIYNSNTDRIASSFGDPAGIAKALVNKGFINVKTDPDGRIIAQRADGTWVKDADGLIGHPLNYLESSAGKALPLAGGVVGGALGNIPGAALGGGGGEAARIGIGKMLGTYGGGMGDAAKDVGMSALTSGAAEGVARLAGAGLKALVPRGTGQAAAEGVEGVAKGEISGTLPEALTAAKEGDNFAPFLDMSGRTVRPDSEEVKAAAENLGIKELPDWMLSNQRNVQNIASTALNSETVGGRMVQRQAEPVFSGMQEAAKELVGEAAPQSLTPYETGEGLKNDLLNSFRQKIAPAVETYEKLEPVMKDIPLEKRGFTRAVTTLSKDGLVSTSPDAQAFLGKWSDIFQNSVNSVGDLKNFRTNLRAAAQKSAGGMGQPMDPGINRVFNTLYDAVTNERDRSILKNVLSEGNQTGVGSMLQAARQNPVVQELRGADQTFGKAVGETADAFGMKSMKGGADNAVENFIGNIKSENLPDWLFSVKDVNKAKALKAAFPEAFETARQAQLSKVLKASYDPNAGEVSATKLVQVLKSYSPEARAMLLGDKLGLGESLMKVREAIPPIVNPSGTSVREGIVRTLYNSVKQPDSFSYPLILKYGHSPMESMAQGASQVSNVLNKYPQAASVITNPALRSVAERYTKRNQSPLQDEQAGKDYFLRSN